VCNDGVCCPEGFKCNGVECISEKWFCAR
jgi:hypothetical protein